MFIDITEPSSISVPPPPYTESNTPYWSSTVSQKYPTEGKINANSFTLIL